MDRRKFLKASGALAAFTIVPRHVLGGNGYIAPSDQLTKGIIGVGGMGRGHFEYGKTRLIAICDVDQKHLKAGQELAAKKAKEGKNVDEHLKLYSDWTKLVEDPSIDVVHIATHHTGMR